MTKESLRELMGENIRSERVSRNISLDELAEMLQLTSGFVGLIERGRRGATAYTLFKLSEIFNISIDNIFARVSGRQLRFAEETDYKSADVRRKKIYSLLNGLSDGELDFVINTVKGIKVMNHTRPYSAGKDKDELVSGEDIEEMYGGEDYTEDDEE